LPRLQDAVRCEALRTAPHFNVFRILDIVHKEAEFHTPFLAHLLDPQAAHGQGLLFLECLFDCWKHRIMPPSGPLDEGNWLVRPEFHLPGFGRLDLLIENVKKKYVLVIENKIGSDDQIGYDDRDDQLSRYRAWMDAYRKGWNGQLVYLTPNGRRPTSIKCRKCLSRNQDIRACGPRPSRAARCKCLSYNRDIRGFLTAASGRIEPMYVRAVVGQYLDILDDLMENYDDNDTGENEAGRVSDERGESLVHCRDSSNCQSSSRANPLAVLAGPEMPT